MNSTGTTLLFDESTRVEPPLDNSTLILTSAEGAAMQARLVDPTVLDARFRMTLWVKDVSVFGFWPKERWDSGVDERPGVTPEQIETVAAFMPPLHQATMVSLWRSIISQMVGKRLYREDFVSFEDLPCCAGLTTDEEQFRHWSTAEHVAALYGFADVAAVARAVDGAWEENTRLHEEAIPEMITGPVTAPPDWWHQIDENGSRGTRADWDALGDDDPWQNYTRNRDEASTRMDWDLGMVLVVLGVPAERIWWHALAEHTMTEILAIELSGDGQQQEPTMQVLAALLNPSL